MCNNLEALVSDHCLSCAAQGRPKGGPEDKFRLTPVVAVLEKALGKPVSDEISMSGDFMILGVTYHLNLLPWFEKDCTDLGKHTS